MKTNVISAPRLVRSLALAAAVAAAAPALAGSEAGYEKPVREREGLILGLNAGGAGSMLMYKDGTRHITEEPLSGGFGQLRVGMGLSRKFALSLEAAGFDSKEDEADWDLGAVLATTTFRPLANGFFLRAGVGVGGGEFSDPVSGEQHSVDGRLAWQFGIGYEWRLGERTGLGLAADTIGIDANGVTGYEEDEAGAAGVTVQLNLYL